MLSRSSQLPLPVGDLSSGLRGDGSGSELTEASGVSFATPESAVTGGALATTIRGVYEATMLALSDVVWKSVLTSGTELVVLCLSTVESNTLLAEWKRRRNTKGVTGCR